MYKWFVYKIDIIDIIGAITGVSVAKIKGWYIVLSCSKM